MIKHFFRKPEQHVSLYREEDLSVSGGSSPGSRFAIFVSTDSIKKLVYFDRLDPGSAHAVYVSAMSLRGRKLWPRKKFAQPMFRLKSGVSTFSIYVLTFSTKMRFDFVLDLKMLLDRGISVAKLHFLDFQSRNKSRAPRPG